MSTTTQRPTPDERMWHDFARKLERERDEALSLLTAEKSARNAIIKKGVELEKKLEAMREAIKAAYEALENADGSSYHIRGDACLTREAFEQRAAALAKLRPLLP